MVDPARIAVVLTAIDVEYDAIYEHLRDVQEQTHAAGTSFHVGRLSNSSWRVAIARTGQGNTPAAVIAERAISNFQPDLMMLVGIAGRLHDDLSLGDIVVATKVYAIHGGKEEDAGSRRRPDTWQPYHRHVELAKCVAGQSTWRDVLSDRPRVAPQVFFRPIASGEVVLNSATSPLAQKLREDYDDAAVIEKEGAGVAVASHLNDFLPMIVVRGVSDYASGEKEETDRAGWQQRAARNAAAFAVTLLTQLVPRRRTDAQVIRAAEQRLRYGNTADQIAAVRELVLTDHADAVPVLAKGFNMTPDSEVSCRIITALAGFGTVEARDALRALNPRYKIEQLMLQDALEAWPKRPQQGDALP